MKLNEITETGYYTCELDIERETIFEVIKNTDEVWLKEAPEQTLLIDEWTYEYTDEDGRKHYEIYGGNLVSVVNAEPFDVVKITDTKYTMDVSDPTIASKCNGTSMMEDKPTRLEIAEQQLRAKEQECEKLKKEVSLLKESNSKLQQIEDANSLEKYYLQQLNQLKKSNEELQKENEKLKKQLQVKEQECEELKKIVNEAKNSKLDLKSFLVGEAVQHEYEQQLDQLKAELEQEKALKETYLACYKAKHEDIEGTLFKLRAENEELKSEIKHYKQIAQYHGNLSVKYTNKSAKLKQTLTEIKEIAKNMNKECFYDDFSCDGCDMINGCTYQGKLSVLQKISECEVENAKN